jgi:hypothetical protein
MPSFSGSLVIVNKQVAKYWFHAVAMSLIYSLQKKKRKKNHTKSCMFYRGLLLYVMVLMLLPPHKFVHLPCCLVIAGNDLWPLMM